eukprot:CAMPEP_0170135754 /NCGR_PEP_ID=MMETSP0033_2-20121228/2636_1 /TAXON_ID=195969 /ORGANISM="Dolichomastix tenuilepis, Strain CCMP3274" /LENGTH=995 /DNA_ID=CAMNT_0010371359 /DNA_START=103 /DNA_END=3090 /DNA_ORIENTATION=-
MGCGSSTAGSPAPTSASEAPSARGGEESILDEVVHEHKKKQRRTSLEARRAGDVSKGPRRRGSVEDFQGRRMRRRVAFSAETMKETIQRRRDQDALPRESLIQASGSAREKAAGAEERSSQPPKDEATVQRIRDSLLSSFLFREMGPEALATIIEAMCEFSYEKGERILQQGALPRSDDSFYIIKEGDVDILVQGLPSEQRYALAEGELVSVSEVPPEKQKDERVVATKSSGDAFGDIALLFSCPRTASVRAASDVVTCWVLDRASFSTHLMEHSRGTRRLQFLREVPLLQNIPDNIVRTLAERLELRECNVDEVIYRPGDDVDALFIIQEGCVTVHREASETMTADDAVLKYATGEFFGELELLRGGTRSQQAIARESGTELLVMRRSDFTTVRALLESVLDDHFKFSTLRSMPKLKDITADQVADVVDTFETRRLKQDDVVYSQGDEPEAVYVVKHGVVTADNSRKMFQTYDFFGSIVEDETICGTTLRVTSPEATVYVLNHRSVAVLLDSISTTARSAENAQLLRGSPVMQHLTHRQLEEVIGEFREEDFAEGEHIISQGEGVEPPRDLFYVVRSGEVVVTKLMEATDAHPKELLRLRAGDHFGERALLTNEPRAANIIASEPVTCLCISRLSFEKHLGPLKEIMEKHLAEVEQRKIELAINFWDLDHYRTVGVGQFGRVNLVKHKFTGTVYALKVLRKKPIVQLGQAEHIQNERDVMASLSSPFCCKLVRAFANEHSLYLLLEVLQGGELFRLLDIEGNFKESDARFYAGCVLLAFEHIHSLGIVYRDLKPENILIGLDGYCKLADFGFAKRIDNGQTHTMCGTPDYQAPEIIARRGHDRAADCWAFGVLVFEMLVGEPPFAAPGGASDDPRETFKRILEGYYTIPNFVSDDAADLIWSLLRSDPRMRLGRAGGAKEVCKHKWFAQFDFRKLERRSMTPPFKPSIGDALDTRNFDDYSDLNKDDPKPLVGSKYDYLQDLWKGWESTEKTPA